MAKSLSSGGIDWCAKFDEFFGAELSAADALIMERHISGCEGCKRSVIAHICRSGAEVRQVVLRLTGSLPGGWIASVLFLGEQASREVWQDFAKQLRNLGDLFRPQLGVEQAKAKPMSGRLRRVSAPREDKR